jgi:hypothetical protein
VYTSLFLIPWKPVVIILAFSPARSSLYREEMVIMHEVTWGEENRN